MASSYRSSLQCTSGDGVDVCISADAGCPSGQQCTYNGPQGTSCRLSFDASGQLVSLTCQVDGLEFDCSLQSNEYACAWSDQPGCQIVYPLNQDPASAPAPSCSDGGSPVDSGPILTQPDGGVIVGQPDAGKLGGDAGCYLAYPDAEVFCPAADDSGCFWDPNVGDLCPLPPGADPCMNGYQYCQNCYLSNVENYFICPVDGGPSWDAGCYPEADAQGGWVCPPVDAGGCYFDEEAGYVCAQDGAYVPVDGSFFIDAGPVADGGCFPLPDGGTICVGPSPDSSFPGSDGGVGPPCYGSVFLDAGVCEVPETADLVWCYPGTQTFPTFRNTCLSDNDCTFRFHQTDCCGSMHAIGIDFSEQSRFISDESVCDLQYPSCQCLASYTTESGQSAPNLGSVSVHCISDTTGPHCQTYVP
jgi:hypothetical protein